MVKYFLVQSSCIWTPKTFTKESNVSYRNPVLNGVFFFTFIENTLIAKMRLGNIRANKSLQVLIDDFDSDTNSTAEGLNLPED